jgi:hypothetical protein
MGIGIVLPRRSRNEAMNGDDQAMHAGHPATSSAVALYEARQRQQWDDPAALDFGSPFPAEASVEIYDSQPRKIPGRWTFLRLLFSSFSRHRLGRK